DRKRKGKGCNEDWRHPHDPDARITKMKDGRTHLAHKAEHAVDLESGAVVAVTVQPANRGDPQSMGETLVVAADNLAAVRSQQEAGEGLSEEILSELVTDKGYHSSQVLVEEQELGTRTYIAEPDRGRRRWKGKAYEQEAVYANRRRIRGERGKRLLRLRGQLIERNFAHCYDTGAMRRVHLRGHSNILKRLLIHVSGFNLSLVLRKALGVGKPRALQGRLRCVLETILCLWKTLGSQFMRFQSELSLRVGNHPAKSKSPTLCLAA
ncbi:unnamed protein product, partial [marine sediment metagenome]